MRFRVIFASFGLAAGVNLSGLAQTPPPPPMPTPSSPVAAPAPAVVKPVPTTVPPVNPLLGLKWDSTLKEATPNAGQPTADFIFTATNATDGNIVIDHVQTSCGCTVAKLPSQPWTLTPGEHGNINVTVNLAGKQGTFMKTVFVFATNLQFKTDLNLKIHMPENPMVSRTRNQQLAMADQQSVFRGDCAKCHGDPVTHGLMGKELYQKACAICHDASQRDSKVPDLHAINHPTDLAFWKTTISYGKPATMMPAFGNERGGPLTEEQIDSLAKVCNLAFIPTGAGVPIKTSQAVPGNPGIVPPRVQTASQTAH